ncbi:vacuolar ATP synthase 16 kDa proteolipid subunit, putative, partial [Bodo saltans]
TLLCQAQVKRKKMTNYGNCDPAAVLFGMLGAAASLALSNVGAAYGTAKAGVSVAHLGIQNPNRVMRGIVPVVMAGILGIYGLIVAVIISNNIKTSGEYMLFTGFMHLGAGLAAGFASLAAGYAIGIIGDICCYAYAKTDKIFVPMILMLIFAEALGLYGLIIALLMNNRAIGVQTSC